MPGLSMLSIQVKSDSFPTQNTPGPRSSGAATVTDSGVFRELSHNVSVCFSRYSGEYVKKKSGCQARNLDLFEKIIGQDRQDNAVFGRKGGSPKAKTIPSIL